MSTMTTLAPAAASISTVARPKSELPPVTRKVLSQMSMIASPRKTAKRSARSSRYDERGSMKQHACHAANRRAVDTIVSQFTLDLRFDLPGDLLCVPAFHDLADQRRQLIR